MNRALSLCEIYYPRLNSLTSGALTARPGGESRVGSRDPALGERGSPMHPFLPPGGMRESPGKLLKSVMTGPHPGPARSGSLAEKDVIPN